MKSPKKPKATAEEKALRARTMRELDRTQDKENRLRKMIAFGRLGTRQLLSGSPMGILDPFGRSGMGGTNPGRSGGSGGAAPGGSSAPGAMRPPGGGGGGGGGSGIQVIR